MRKSITVVTVIVILLAATESLLIWKVYSHDSTARKIAFLERALSEKNAEMDRLIFIRDIENRKKAGHQQSIHRQVPESPESELAAATARAAMESPEMKPNEGEGPTDLGPQDVDPTHLVNMANIMTGKKVAELTHLNGNWMIHYRKTEMNNDDPIWEVLDALQEAHVLKEVLLVGKTTADLGQRKEILANLVQFGLPSSLIHMKTGDAHFEGMDGMFIRIVNKRGDRT